MFQKNRIIAILTGLALLAAVTGSSGIVADRLGYMVTSQAHACNSSSSAGGGC